MRNKISPSEKRAATIEYRNTFESLQNLRTYAYMLGWREYFGLPISPQIRELSDELNALEKKYEHLGIHKINLPSDRLTIEPTSASGILFMLRYDGILITMGTKKKVMQMAYSFHALMVGCYEKQLLSSFPIYRCELELSKYTKTN